MRTATMPTEILRDIKGSELPQAWIRKFHLDPDKAFDVEIKPKEEDEILGMRERGEDFDVTKDPLYLIEGYDIAAPADASANIDKDLYGASHPA